MDNKKMITKLRSAEDRFFDLQEMQPKLTLQSIGKRFNYLTDALGYLNRGGHYFEERNTLKDATIIAIANDIYYKKNGTYAVC